MRDPSETTPSEITPSEPIAEPPAKWYATVGDLLEQAAILCADNGLDLDSFMRGAWSAYMTARPALRDELEERQLRAQLDEMRKHGNIGLA